MSDQRGQQPVTTTPMPVTARSVAPAAPPAPEDAPARRPWICPDGGLHPSSRRTGPGWWTCEVCGGEWPGPNY